MRPIYETPLPTGWTERPLRSLTTRHRGYSWEKEQEAEVGEPGAVPVIRIPNVQQHLDLRDLLYLRGVQPEDVEAFSVRRGWILFVASNGNPDRIGDSVLIKDDEAMLFASFLQAVSSCSPEELAPNFLARWLQLNTVHQTISKTSQQTTGLANFSWGAVKNLPVRYPAQIEEQKRIDSAISAVDRAVQCADEELTACKSVSTALVQELFQRHSSVPGEARSESKIGVFPKDWEIRPLRDLLAEPPLAGTSPDEARPEPPGTPTMNVACLQEGVFSTAAQTYIDVSDDVLARYQVRRGDFFVIRGNGNVDLVAKGGTLQAEPERPTIYSDLLIRLRFTDETEPGFIPWLWGSQAFVRRLQSKAKTGSGLWKIGQRDIRHHLVPIPPKPQQRLIIQVLEAAQSASSSAWQRKAELERFRGVVLKNLLTGRVRLSTGEAT